MKNFFSGSKLKIFLHVLAWVIILGIPLYFFKRWDIDKDFIWGYYIGNAINGIIFYTNYLILIPKYFFERKKLKYFLYVFFLLGFLFIVSDKSNELIFRYMPREPKTDISNTQVKSTEVEKFPPPKPDNHPGRPPFREMHFFNYMFTSLFLIFFSLGMRVLERHSQTEKLQKELEKEKLNSELAFLKNQISPHFFFNTLNNIYSLISINAEDSQKAVLRLSKLMRYLLYDSEHGNTRLSNEIDFMNNYIDLMKLRMSSKINLTVSFPEKYEDINIPPLIFIPFIENAFKHGISYREKSFIRINMQTEKDAIVFACANSIVKSREENDADHSGIGLENVKKRLSLLFPGKHDLQIIKSEAEFEVTLRINFA
jgi:two-component system, LytTR family, sensor kinase